MEEILDAEYIRDELNKFFEYIKPSKNDMHYPLSNYEQLKQLRSKTEILEKVLDYAIRAREKGITLDQLLAKNKTVRTWYDADIQSRAAQSEAAIKEAARAAKFAEKKRLAEEARAAVMAKMTPEEIEAFGLNKKRAKK